MKGVSVIMPTYNQGAFILRALNSLKFQTFEQWELIIINDGSNDDTEIVIAPWLSSNKIKYVKNDFNLGLGASINIGLELCSYDLIAYLPSDDVYFSNHLESLYETITFNNAFLACSGLLHTYNESLSASEGKYSLGKIENNTYQLVQIMHQKTPKKWLDRNELVTGNLDLMFWDELLDLGKHVETGMVTAEWVSHPTQRHKIISEVFGGGLKAYKEYYQVKDPLVFAGGGNYIDELAIPNELTISNISKNENPLKILIIGELAFNPERILAFEQQGHKLYGLWIQASGFLCNVGPFYFSNIETISSINDIDNIKPDVIYALLNYGSVSLAHKVMLSHRHIPFVWHFKESPFYCRQQGLWNKLIDLYRLSDGQIYINDIVKNWFDQATGNNSSLSFILDGDLPKIDWFKDNRSSLLSTNDGAYHTVVPGRPYGIHPNHIAMLSKQNIHFHFYGNFQQNLWIKWINEANRLAPGFLHLHDNCEPYEWTNEFSKYDAGWLHIYDCDNYGELTKTTWNELNLPARIPTLAAAGLPMLLKDNSEHICATQELVDKLRIGISFKSFYEIGDKLSDSQKMESIRNNVWNERTFFSFDAHIEKLTDFFKQVIAKKHLKS